MNKTDLVKAVANDTGRSEALVEQVMDSLLKVITVGLSAGEPVTLRRFGRFEERIRKPVMRRNPRTGEEHKVPKRRTVAFIPGETLRARLNR